MKIGVANEKLDAHEKVRYPMICLSFFLTWNLLFELNQSFLNSFLIICLVFCFEILKGCILFYKLCWKLSLALRRVNMSEWCFVEHKRICCLMFIMSNKFEDPWHFI